ncbi:ABC transporter substrate-binding protein [soil metagenome]
MKTDRRKLLQTAAATGTALTIGGATFRHQQTSAAAQTSTGTIDNLRIAMSSLPPQLDPQTTGWIVMSRVYNMVFDTLIMRDWANGGEFVPGLATEWTQVDDTTIDFTLREGVVFHDGTPLTANDVKFTLERSLQGDAKLGVTGQYPIESVTVTDDHHFSIKTTGPRGGFLIKLTGNDSSIISQAYFNTIGYEGFQQMPLGTGPFKVTEYIPDQHILFDANEQYWGGVPAAKKVTLTGIPEVSTRVAALMNDEVDMIMDLPPDQVETVTSAGDYNITDVSPMNSNIYAIVGNAPLDKKEIRQALNIGFDRQAIVEQLLGGYGVWPTGIQQSVDPLYSERPQLAYDPERAKELLASIGYAGEEIKLAFDSPNYYPLEQEWTQAIVSMWSDIGLNVSMSPIDVNQRVLIAPTDPWNLFTSSQGVTAEPGLKTTYASPTSAYQKLFVNEAPGTFDELNETVNALEQSVDLAERIELAKKAFDFLEDFVMVLTIVTINRISASKSEINFQEARDFGLELRAGKFSIAS